MSNIEFINSRVDRWVDDHKWILLANFLSIIFSLVCGQSVAAVALSPLAR